jgi:hypothetical protein
MATEAQIEANRANAQKSTGPRTPEGKEKAAQNALKHGLLAREAVVVNSKLFATQGLGSIWLPAGLVKRSQFPPARIKPGPVTHPSFGGADEGHRAKRSQFPELGGRGWRMSIPGHDTPSHRLGCASRPCHSSIPLFQRSISRSPVIE